MTSWSRLKRHVIVQLHTHVCDNSSAQAQTRPVPWMFSWELTLVITSLLDSAVFQPLARYFLPPVSALTARLARVCLLLLGGSLATSLPFFFRGSQLCLLLLSHSRRLRSPLFSFWCVMRVAGHLAQRYWTVRVSRRAEKNQSPEPRYVCAVCRLHSTFSASPSSSASILTQHPTPERTISPRNCHNKTLHL